MSARTVAELTKMERRVYVFLRDGETARELMQDSEAEGFFF